jgi:hypothetical protein
MTGVTRSSKRALYDMSENKQENLALCTNLGHATEAKSLQAVLNKTCRMELVVSAQALTNAPCVDQGTWGGRTTRLQGPLFIPSQYSIVLFTIVTKQFW